ncbi:hypothetical protein [Paenibacillus sp. LHD-38]|nr:hypothetical protein [Paenibacillus sp. LHD-38]MDQ8734838.1 hypothetical protein [Paenibacillus sp. LHD-38]
MKIVKKGMVYFVCLMILLLFVYFNVPTFALENVSILEPNE